MRVELRILKGSRAGESFALEDGHTVVFGRGSEATHRIQDPSISRRHCQICNTTSGLIISDLGSSNGTFVNSQRVTSALLNLGDCVMIGQNEIRIAAPSSPQQQQVPGQTHPSPHPEGGFAPPYQPPATAPSYAGNPSYAGQPPPQQQPSFAGYPPQQGSFAAPPGFYQGGYPPQHQQPHPGGPTPAPQHQPRPAYGYGPPGAPNGSYAGQYPPQQQPGNLHGSGVAPPPPGGPPAVMPSAMGAFRQPPGQPQQQPPPTGRPCGKCGRPISDAELEQGLARTLNPQQGTFSCPQCWGAFDFQPDLIRGYRIERKLGSGAFGSVYRALMESTGIIVAIKTIRPEFVGNEKDLKRFFREAETTKELQHNNIMAVHDYGVDGDTCYIAMEFIDGKALHDVISERKHLDVSLSTSVGLQIADALAHAFEKSIVHRDIKPENILLSKSGEAKLVDFGLAKCFRTSGQSGLTAFGEGMGTLAYMPPEQIDNALMADQRSDIYSLGASIYHMLSGRRPFEEKTTRSFIMKILKENPPQLRGLNPDVPAELEAVIEKAMAKEPKDRFQKPSEMKKKLETILRGLE